MEVAGTAPEAEDADDGEIPFPGLPFDAAVEPVPETPDSVGVVLELVVEAETEVDVDEEDEFGIEVTVVSETGMGFVAAVCGLTLAPEPAVDAAGGLVAEVPGDADVVAGPGFPDETEGGVGAVGVGDGDSVVSLGGTALATAVEADGGADEAVGAVTDDFAAAEFAADETV